MKRVVICSPWRGDEALHARYLDACLLDAYNRDEAPYASHAIGPRVLREDVSWQRATGIAAGYEWIYAADLVAVYEDLGISEGMEKEIQAATAKGIPIEHRSLPDWRAVGAPPEHASEISDREVCRAVLRVNPADGVAELPVRILAQATRGHIVLCRAALRRAIDRGLVELDKQEILTLTEAGRRLLHLEPEGSKR